MSDDEFKHSRYSALTQLWTHHNQILFQWPAIILTAALVVISVLISDVLNRIRHTPSWREDISLRLEAGVPALLTGVALILMLYSMGRSRRIILALDDELNSIEQSSLTSPFVPFNQLNHPSGLSAPSLLRWFMALFLAAPLTLLGFALSFGNLLSGTIAWGFLLAAWYVLERHNIRSRPRGRYGRLVAPFMIVLVITVLAAIIVPRIPEPSSFLSTSASPMPKSDYALATPTS